MNRAKISCSIESVRDEVGEKDATNEEMLDELILPAHVLELESHATKKKIVSERTSRRDEKSLVSVRTSRRRYVHLSDDSTEFTRCSADPMSRRTVSSGKDFSRNNERSRVGSEVLEEVGEAVEEDEGGDRVGDL